MKQKEVFKTNQLVAVYGTLKRGFNNHRLLSRADFIGEGVTKDLYRLCVSGLPFLIEGISDEGKNVEVEVYMCNPFEMMALDALEGHPSFYERKMTPIVLSDGETYNAWVYFVKDNAHYNNGVYHESFTGAENYIGY